MGLVRGIGEGTKLARSPGILDRPGVFRHLQPVFPRHWKAQRRIRSVSVKNRLKVLRAEHNWSQAVLGDKLDVSRQTINAIETGKYDPSLPLAFKIARLFGQTIEEIFHDETV